MVDDGLLVDYASGALPEPVALAVATHLSLNQEASAAYAELNSVGGALLEDVDGEIVSDTLLDRVLDRLDEPAPAASSRARLDERTREIVPGPLQAYLVASLDDLPWKKKGGAVEEARLKTNSPDYRVSLLRIKPGQAMPMHSHRGCEYTVVLDGAYHDQTGVFERGDFSEADAEDHHRPIADEQRGCMCLIVLDQPVRLDGPLGWMLNPFLKN